ncbi:MAG: zinc-dependent alcohol dehydrogenase family protein [bacterium]
MLAYILKEFSSVEDSPLVSVDVPTPEIGKGKVLIKVSACGVCHTDLHTVEGEIKPKLPIIPGHEIVGRVVQIGEDVSNIKVGDRVGAGWLGYSCGECRFCKSGLENLCENALFTGFHLNGGYAEYTSINADFIYPLPDNLEDVNVAPLLCAGIIGYRSIKLANVHPNSRVALFGFGASAHIAIQILKKWGCDVYVFSRSDEHQLHAMKLGALWTGEANDDPPSLVDSAIVFAPAGFLVKRALEVLDKSGTLSLAGIYMTQIPQLSYKKHLYYEKTVRSVTASTRSDGYELLKIAKEIPIKTDVEIYSFNDVPEVLIRMKEGKIKGAAVIKFD